MPLTLTSAALKHGSSIPIHHTCEGADRSSPLAWHGLPFGIQSLALAQAERVGIYQKRM